MNSSVEVSDFQHHFSSADTCHWPAPGACFAGHSSAGTRLRAMNFLSCVTACSNRNAWLASFARARMTGSFVTAYW